MRTPHCGIHARDITVVGGAIDEEIWQEFDAVTRETLESLSIVPFVTSELADLYTGSDQAVAVLSDLARRRFFVEDDTSRGEGAR